MFKKGFMLILAFMLVLSFSAFSYAEEELSATATFSRKTTKLSVSGNISADEGERVHLVVLKPGIDFSGLSSAQSMESAILRVDEATVSADGSFSFAEITMTGAHSLGNCSWRVSGAGKTTEGSFYYSPLEKIIEIINNFDKTAESGIYGYLITNENKDPLGLDAEDCAVYEKLSAEERKYADAFLAEKSYAAASGADEETVNDILKTIKDDFKEKVAIALLNDAKDAEEVKGAIEKYNDVYEFDKTYGGLFDGLSDTNKEKAETELYERIAKADRFADRAILNDFAETERVLTALKFSDWEDLEEIIKENNDVLELDLDDFDSLSSYKKDKVMKVLKESGSFDSVADLEEALTDATDAQEESGGSSGGGGGGGSKSNGASSVLVDFVKETKPSENAQKTEIFDDIKSAEWAKEAIEALYAKKIVSGKSAKSFCPSDTVTRAEFVKMLVLVSGKTEKATISFSDVSDKDWFYDYVAISVGEKMVNGFEDGSFKPDDEISRQDMATIIYRLLSANGISGKNGAKVFADSTEISDYAKKATEDLSSLGIFSGDENGKFNPKKSASRAEAAKVIYGVLQLIEG